MWTRKVILVLSLTLIVVIGGIIIVSTAAAMHMSLGHDVKGGDIGALLQSMNRAFSEENAATERGVAVWQKLESQDDSAIRAILYEQRIMSLRMVNIDSTIEEMSLSLMKALHVMVFYIKWLIIISMVIIVLSIAGVFLLLYSSLLLG